MTETFHMRFYYGMAPCYLISEWTKENAAIWGVSLLLLGLWRGPSWSQVGDMLCLDTDKVGWHDRDIPYKILLWDGPLLLKYKCLKFMPSYQCSHITYVLMIIISMRITTISYVWNHIDSIISSCHLENCFFYAVACSMLGDAWQAAPFLISPTYLPAWWWLGIFCFPF